jgi:hypothetical protein
MLWHNRVPENATDVWFISAYMSTRIDCKLDQDEFLAWCHRRGWEPTPIDTAQPKYMHSDRLGDVIKIESGFVFDAIYDSAGRGNTGLYDAKSGRAYVLYRGR